MCIYINKYIKRIYKNKYIRTKINRSSFNMQLSRGEKFLMLNLNRMQNDAYS